MDFKLSSVGHNSYQDFIQQGLHESNNDQIVDGAISSPKNLQPNEVDNRDPSSYDIAQHVDPDEASKVVNQLDLLKLENPHIGSVQKIDEIDDENKQAEEVNLSSNQSTVKAANVGERRFAINPVRYFTKFAMMLGSDVIKTASTFLNKNYVIYSVGSGNGAVELFLEFLGFKVICIDPNPKCYEGPLLKKPNYKYLKDLPKMEKDAILLLVSPDPELTYDIEAIEAHKWRQVMMIYEDDGCALSSDAVEWLKNVEYNKHKSYGVAYKKSNCIKYSSATEKYIPTVVVLDDPANAFRVIDETDTYIFDKDLLEMSDFMGLTLSDATKVTKNELSSEDEADESDYEVDEGD